MLGEGRSLAQENSQNVDGFYWKTELDAERSITYSLSLLKRHWEGLPGRRLPCPFYRRLNLGSGIRHIWLVKPGVPLSGINLGK